MRFRCTIFCRNLTQSILRVFDRLEWLVGVDVLRRPSTPIPLTIDLFSIALHPHNKLTRQTIRSHTFCSTSCIYKQQSMLYAMRCTISCIITPMRLSCRSKNPSHLEYSIPSPADAVGINSIVCWSSRSVYWPKAMHDQSHKTFDNDGASAYGSHSNGMRQIGRWGGTYGRANNPPLKSRALTIAN